MQRSSLLARPFLAEHRIGPSKPNWRGNFWTALTRCLVMEPGTRETPGVRAGVKFASRTPAAGDRSRGAGTSITVPKLGSKSTHCIVFGRSQMLPAMMSACRLPGLAFDLLDVSLGTLSGRTPQPCRLEDKRADFRIGRNRPPGRCPTARAGRRFSDDT